MKYLADSKRSIYVSNQLNILLLLLTVTLGPLELIRGEVNRKLFSC